MSTSLNKTLDLFFVWILEFLVRYISVRWILNLWWNTGCAVSWPHSTCNKFPNSISWLFIRSLSSELCRCLIDFIYNMLKTIVTLRDTLPVESVCLNNIRTCIQISFVNAVYNIRLSQNEKIIVVLQLLGNIFKSVTYTPSLYKHW